MESRCWNCSRYALCDDYRTFAWGCLCCDAHQRELSFFKTLQNLTDFQRVKKQGPLRVEEEPLPEWVYSPFVKPESY